MQKHPAQRGAAAGSGALFAGAVHLALASQLAAHTPALGAAFLVVGVSLVAGGTALILGVTRALQPTGALSLATALSYVAVHTGVVGLAHPHDHAAVIGGVTTAVELVVAGLALVSASRRTVSMAIVAALGLALVPAVVQADQHSDPTQPAACIEPNRRMTLYAEELPREEGKIRIGWGRTPESASIPGPLIELVEGDCIAITVVNDVARSTLEELWAVYHDGQPPTPEDAVGISLHVHGVKYTPRSDGTVQNDSWVPPGGRRTFVWYAAPRATVGGRVVSLGTAGYWWYHDHIAGTDHGTGGLDAGLFGGMIVRRPGDLRPDVTHTVVLGPGPEINFNRYPDTFTCDPPEASASCFVARQGQRVEFLVLTVGDNFHTFHLHGHTWADNRTGMFTSQLDETRLVDVRTLGPSETFGFQVIAGEEVGPGIWMLHCHVQTHSDDGMATFFKVLEQDGTDPFPSVPQMAGHGGHGH